MYPERDQGSKCLHEMSCGLCSQALYNPLSPQIHVILIIPQMLILLNLSYEGWNFNFGNAVVTFDIATLQSSYFQTLDVLPNIM
jgi:hypothetical protein